jgi:hypothetical protein
MAARTSLPLDLRIERPFQMADNQLLHRSCLCYDLRMETIVRNVRDLPQPDRSAMERVLGHQLRESQQLVIQVMSIAVEETDQATPATGQLPDWCNVYKGLTDAEIDELDSSIVRSHSSRDFS